MNSSNTFWQFYEVSRASREKQHGHRAFVVWFTGLSGSGKTTLARAVETKLHAQGKSTYVLDGDNIRHGLCADLGFDSKDRTENIRRVGEVSKLFVEAGLIVLAAFISPNREDRQKVRNLIGESNFIEVYCDCPLAVCEQRDVKGLYQKARSCLITEFTGISAPYEAPTQPDLHLKTHQENLEQCVDRVMGVLDV